MVPKFLRQRTPDCNDVQVVITVICVGIKMEPTS